VEYFFVLAIIFCIISTLYFFCYTKKDSVNSTSISDFHSVLTVRNCEDSIEGIIRSLVWQINTTKNMSLFPKKLIVIDINSEDKTLLILKKLSKEYPFIYPMSTGEYTEYIKHLHPKQNLK